MRSRSKTSTGASLLVKIGQLCIIMPPMRPLFPTFRIILLLCGCAPLYLLAGCESDRPVEPVISGVSNEVPVSPPSVTTAQTTPQAESVSPQFHIDNYQFVFDASNHSAEELLAFLQRVDEIASMSLADFDELNIALVLQGSDIAMFVRDNYEQNKQLVDLAARLDALNVIDMKVCQHDLQHQGYGVEDMPAFIERIPYAREEMKRLEGAGYFML